ncbi:MAG: S-layer homology domain-containing protein [Firmicutes bacterium]|nr:S-layer homology domain-containing protein [Bacillota bacterium]
MKKRIIALLLVIMAAAQPAYASILGSVSESWSHDIANGTYFYKNTFLSQQSGVGMQAEYYAEYTPNDKVVPAVVTAESIWGLRTITSAEKYMRDNGMVPLIGINASFFSWKTGVPMGHILSDGKIMSKDTETYQSVGFLEDGKAFIAPLSIKTTLTSGDMSVDVAHINKYNQTVTDVVNLYTEDFADNNHTESAALDLILNNVEGTLGVGKTVTATVEEKFNYTGSVKIPAGKIVLTVNETARPELYEALNSLNVGDRVTISSSALDDERWKIAVSGLGSVGDTLIKNGEVQSGFQKGAAPRTAVGITESGNVIFYVIDGRQQPYSYGVQIQTLANRLKELGCVDAINLDGGGSSAILGVYPGSDSSAILNSPSEGKLRTCSSYIFLKNVQQPTGTPGHLYAYPFEQHYLSGYSEEIYPVTVDTAYYKMNNPDDLAMTVSGTESTVDASGILTAKGDGKFTVNLSGGGASGSAVYHTYETPTNINVYNGETNAEIKRLSLRKGDRVKLSITAQHYYINLKVNKDCFNYEVTNNLGYVDENGELVITANSGSGVMRVSAGGYSKEIPVSVNFETPFKDISEHWARDNIQNIYEKHIISGYETDNGLYFMPDNNITREEFAVIMCRYMGVDADAYKNTAVDFADEAEISSWAKSAAFALYEKGIITGKAKGDKIYFAPSDTLTRAEAMTILGRTLSEQSEGSLIFADSDKIPSWAEQYIGTMVLNGYVSGYEDNTLRPQSSVTRAEAVTMIAKMQ